MCIEVTQASWASAQASWTLTWAIPSAIKNHSLILIEHGLLGQGPRLLEHMPFSTLYWVRPKLYN
jgi:hypothetical protein